MPKARTAKNPTQVEQPEQPAEGDAASGEAAPDQGAPQAARHAPESAPDAATASAKTIELTPDLLGSIEAVLLSTERPVNEGKLAEAVGLIRPAADDSETPPLDAIIRQAIADAVAALNAAYDASGRSFRVETVAGGYRVMTLPKFAAAVATYHKTKVASKLTRAAVETLAIIAYKQPITRAELEAIRGVSCGEVLKSLMERRLITIKGRAEELGRPMLYGTTKAFLDHFGLASIKELPAPADLKPAP